MSADNAIYVLISPRGREFEYRVLEHSFTHIEDLLEREDWLSIRKIFADCTVFTEDKVMQEAERLEDSYSFVEYGICTIDMPEEF